MLANIVKLEGPSWYAVKNHAASQLWIKPTFYNGFNAILFGYPMLSFLFIFGCQSLELVARRDCWRLQFHFEDHPTIKAVIH